MEDGSLGNKDSLFDDRRQRKTRGENYPLLVYLSTVLINRMALSFNTLPKTG